MCKERTEFNRICQGCGKELFYKNKISLIRAIKRNSCINCTTLRKKELTEFIRICPECKKLSYYINEKALIDAIKRNFCTRCSSLHKKESQILNFLAKKERLNYLDKIANGI